MNETLKKVILTDGNSDTYTFALTQKQLDLLEYLVDNCIRMIDANIEVIDETQWIEI